MPEIAAPAEKLTLRQGRGRRTLLELVFDDWRDMGARVTTDKMPVARRLMRSDLKIESPHILQRRRHERPTS